MPRSQLPHSLRALGRESLPRTIRIPAGQFHFVRTFKHDFFAATALYEGSAGRVVLKVGRKADFLGMPLGGIGRFLARREALLYQQLQDINAVPEYLGRWGRHGFVHRYVEGHPLQRGAVVPDEFFRLLRQAIAGIHARGMAYVDLEKPQNVILGSDGRPYLIDFQISWHWPRHLGGETWPARRLRKWLQDADLYHLGKLQRRTRPDQLSPAQLAETYRRPWYIKLHQRLTRPATRIRRRTLERLGSGRQTGERGAVS